MKKTLLVMLCAFLIIVAVSVSPPTPLVPVELPTKILKTITPDESPGRPIIYPEPYHFWLEDGITYPPLVYQAWANTDPNILDIPPTANRTQNFTYYLNFTVPSTVYVVIYKNQEDFNGTDVAPEWFATNGATIGYAVNVTELRGIFNASDWLRSGWHTITVHHEDSHTTHWFYLEV